MQILYNLCISVQCQFIKNYAIFCSIDDIFSWCFIVLGVLIICGNILVVSYVYAVKRTERNMFMHFKASLAISDLTNGIV